MSRFFRGSNITRDSTNTELLQSPVQTQLWEVNNAQRQERHRKSPMCKNGAPIWLGQMNAKWYKCKSGEAKSRGRRRERKYLTRLSPDLVDLESTSALASAESKRAFECGTNKKTRLGMSCGRLADNSTKELAGTQHRVSRL